MYPGLVAGWEEKKRGKEARKAKQGKAKENKIQVKVCDKDGRSPRPHAKSVARLKARREQDSDDEQPVVKKVPAKSQPSKITPLHMHEEEEEESDVATVIKKDILKVRGKPPATKKSLT